MKRETLRKLCICILDYFVGIFIAYLFCRYFIFTLLFFKNRKIDYTIFLITLLLFGIGYILIPRFKCIVLLIGVSLLGKEGRNFIRALCISYLVFGPIVNIASNGNEITRVFGCSTRLTYNLTKTRLELMARPFENVLSTSKDDVARIAEEFKVIKTMIEPIIHEIESDDIDDDETANRTKRTINEKYKKKLEMRCRSQLQKGAAKCRLAFKNTMDSCMESIPRFINHLLCWPLRIDFICDINIIDPDKACVPDDIVVDPELEKSYYKLKKIVNETVYENQNGLEMDYKVVMPRVSNVTVNEVVDEVLQKKIAVQRVMEITNDILGFLFIKIIYDCYCYQKNYIKKIDHDNIYITQYFEILEARRKQERKPGVLPLNKFEKKNIIFPTTFKNTKNESKYMVFYVIQLAMEAIAASLFILIDLVIYTLLDIIADKSRITFYQEGSHLVFFKVNGTGVLAKLLRKSLNGFNIHENISVSLTNEPCLPRPTKVSEMVYYQLALVYILALILVIKASWAMRLRRFVCSLVYPKREKKRILYLYNSLLKKRRKPYNSIRSEYKEVMANTGSSFKGMFTKRKPKCVVCSGLNADHLCQNENCATAYCTECWNLLEQRCVACGLKNQLKEEKA